MSQAFDGNFLGITNVNNLSNGARSVDQANERFDSVAHIAKAAGLLAITVDADGFAVERGFDKVGQHHAVAAGLARADGVEQTDDNDGQLLFLPIRQGEKFIERFGSGVTPAALGGGAKDEVGLLRDRY